MFKILFIFSVLATFLVSSTSAISGPVIIISDPVDGPLEEDWRNGWNKVGTTRDASFNSFSDGLTPRAGIEFWSVFRSVRDASSVPAGVRRFFSDTTFQAGTYRLTFDMGRGNGWDWPARSPAIHLVADIDGTGEYVYGNRLSLTAVENPPPIEGEWEQWIYEIRIGNNTQTVNGDPVLGKRFGFLLLRSVSGSEGYAFDNLEISFIPEP